MIKKVRIVVDKIPEIPERCLFSIRGNYIGNGIFNDWIFSCSLRNHICTPDECPYLIDANTIRKDSIELFTKKLLKQPIVDKSVVKRISEQIEEEEYGDK